MDFLTLPKVELHVHLLGAIPHNVLRELIRRHPPIEIWSGYDEETRHLIETRAPHLLAFISGERSGEPEVLLEYLDFWGFLVSFSFTCHLVCDRDDLSLLCKSVTRELASQGIVYAEILFSLPTYLIRGLTLEDVSSAFSAAEEIAGIEVRWMIDLVRNYGARAAEDLVRMILDWGDERVIGIHLGGSEAEYRASCFAEAFRLARGGGLRL